MTIRVVLATRLYPPEVGAAAFRLKALAEALETGGSSVVVLTTRPPVQGYKPEKKVSRWPVLRDAGGNVRGYIQYLSFDLPLFFRLLFTSADVVVSEPPPTTGLMVAVSSWLRKRPYVYYAADVWTDALVAMGASAPVVSVMRWVEGIALRNAAGVVAISEGVADQLGQFGVPSDRVHVVGNGIDTETFSPGGVSEQPGHPYFVYTGTMSEWQGAEVFIHALAQLHDRKDVRLYFFGQGSSEPDLRKLAERVAPGRVVFGGVRPPGETAAWIRGAAGALVSIVPNKGYDFAKPTKIYAAAACGTAVVFAGAGASAEMVSGNGLGESVPYQSEKVAAAMRKLLEESDESPENRVRWVQENASLKTAGRRAAAVVQAAVR
ncbi:glycosyltransferase [Arthrobacter sp. JZ12]|uniref:glycosyltransferase family 4 protein n=1 Tax=Arthrobacter sp. JZ12 TaxID=2654190 RepID=UPI002B4A369B|nr:glycosyltransferase family 4 protein [Arthrobacter sp. JZ12]WRH25392.1 glycosyltransferase [Arthrobacter sp. JZ12]